MPELLELPIDRPRPALQTHAGAWLRTTVPSELTAAVHAVGRAENCTLFMVLIAVFDIVLARYAGTTDIVVGTPIAGRGRTELEGLIGFFVNTLVLRTSVDGNPTFRELLGRVRQTALDAYAHQDLPFEKLVEVLRPPRSRSYNPIVQVLFTVHNQPVSSVALDGLAVEAIDVSNNTAKFDLSVHVAERDGELQFGFGYNPDLFDAETIEEFARTYKSILTTVSRDVEVRLSGLGEWPASVATPDWSGTLVARFVSQVRRAPHALAVRATDAALSYRALDEPAHGLAELLLSLPLAPDPPGTPATAYSAQPTIQPAWRQADGWRIETVLQADGDPFGQTISLALDAADTPHLTYFVATDLTQLDGVVFYLRGVAKAG